MEENKGYGYNWIYTTFFVVFLIVYQFTFHDYVLKQADQYLDDRFWGTNPAFGYFMFLIFLLETIALYFGVKHLSYLKYTQFDLLQEDKGCLLKFNHFLIGVGLYFHIIYVFFIELIIQNATGNSLLGVFCIFLLFAREGYFVFHFYRIVYGRKREKLHKKPLSNKMLIAVNVVLSICSIVFFNITWDLLVPNLYGFFVLVFLFAMVLFLPVRIYFVLLDFLDSQNKQQVMVSLATNVGLIALAMIKAMYL